MIMACFDFMYNLWLCTFVQSMISIIRSLVATGTGSVWARIWCQEVLSVGCVESVDPDADSNSEVLSSGCFPYGSGCDSINAIKIL